MKKICDTHVLLFWADAKDRIPARINRLLETAIQDRTLACSDISLWEIAMLCARGRLQPKAPPARYMHDIMMAMRLEVLPITPEIAVISQSGLFSHKDPADRIIAATAIHHKASLITADDKLRAIETLETIW
jgi:PIN domain nuclease of toxin-antitoxin system